MPTKLDAALIVHLLCKLKNEILIVWRWTQDQQVHSENYRKSWREKKVVSFCSFFFSYLIEDKKNIPFRIACSKEAWTNVDNKVDAQPVLLTSTGQEQTPLCDSGQQLCHNCTRRRFWTTTIQLNSAATLIQQLANGASTMSKQLCASPYFSILQVVGHSRHLHLF